MQQQYNHENYLENYAPQMSDWSTGLFDCHNDISGSLEICCCNMCQLSRQYSMLKYKNPEINVEMCIFILFLNSLFLPYGSLLTTFKIRNLLQEKYNFDRNDFGKDIISAILCLPCMMCQNYREMSIRNEWTGGFIVSRPYVINTMK